MSDREHCAITCYPLTFLRWPPFFNMAVIHTEMYNVTPIFDIETFLTMKNVRTLGKSPQPKYH